MAKENDYNLEGEVEIDESFAGGKIRTDTRIKSGEMSGKKF